MIMDNADTATARARAVASCGVGAPIRRVGGVDRVTGAQRFLADLRLDGMLHVKLVTLDCARARIVAIDTAAAEQIPGVRCVMTAADLPQPVARFGPVYQDRPILAVGETTYHGEAVAAVAADDMDAAEAGAAAVGVRYEQLPGVYSVAAALAPGAPLVRDPALRPDDPLAGTNVLKERHFGWGDITASEPDLVVEHDYTFPMVTHFAIEPHGFIAAPQGGGLAVWSSVQHPYLLQRCIADLFDLPLSRVRVYAPDPGGAFGGKQSPKYEPLLAFLALRTGRPCRLVLTLEETFQTVRRTSAQVRVRSGFAADGTLLFHDIESNYLIGAYADIAERVVVKSNYLACGPYRVPAALIVARAILSHTTPSTAFRGFGTPQISWAVESQIDEAARRLGIDRLAIRLRNLAARGDPVVPGEVPADGDWPESVRRAAEAVGWGRPLPPGRGRGLAVGIKAGATTGLSQATVRLLFDGSAIIYAGTSDMGQGARTVFAQIAADELGTAVDRVTVVSGDTSVVPFDLQTSASRSTVFMGNAILHACRSIRGQLRTLAAAVYSTPEADIDLGAGVVLFSGREIPFPEVIRVGLGRLRGELIGSGSMRKEDDADHPLGGSPAFYEFNCTAFEVEVDTETGELTLHRHVTVGDIGTALNPLQVESQEEGAAIMGLGHSLMEHIVLDESGRISNLGALDYRIPTFKDVPRTLTSISVENHDGPGPYGAKGIAEGSVLCTSPALASAVTEATGVVVRDLPLTPERIWWALKEHHRSDDDDSAQGGTR
jgi:CO/xanthine dehydrogenase Mo-binding subunit